MDRLVGGLDLGGMGLGFNLGWFLPGGTALHQVTWICATYLYLVLLILAVLLAFGLGCSLSLTHTYVHTNLKKN